MVLEISKTPRVGGIYFSLAKSVPFGRNQREDTFEYATLSRYTTENALRKMISANPKIPSILKNIPVELNMSEFNALMQGHAKDTQTTAKGIIENLPFALRGQVDEKAVSDAAYLHDIGKALIPREILNKNSKLNSEETEIMHKHAELGYEMLKTTNINKKTLDLIRNHHQNSKHSGYPFVNKNFKADLNLQILSAADKYSALTEKRVYKDALTPQEALTIIYRDVEEEKLHPLVFKALNNYIAATPPVKAAV